MRGTFALEINEWTVHVLDHLSISSILMNEQTSVNSILSHSYPPFWSLYAFHARKDILGMQIIVGIEQVGAFINSRRFSRSRSRESCRTHEGTDRIFIKSSNHVCLVPFSWKCPLPTQIITPSGCVTGIFSNRQMHRPSRHSVCITRASHCSWKKQDSFTFAAEKKQNYLCCFANNINFQTRANIFSILLRNKFSDMIFEKNKCQFYLFLKYKNVYRKYTACPWCIKYQGLCLSSLKLSVNLGFLLICAYGEINSNVCICTHVIAFQHFVNPW